MKKILLFSVVCLFFSELIAQVVWYGDPNKSVTTSFRRFDRGNYPQDVCNGGDASTQSSVTTVNDPVYGKVWRIHKPKKRKRGEFARTSYIPKNGETLYYGWRWKITSNPDVTGGIAVFQWKADGTTNNTQNYPFNMGYGGGQLNFKAYGPCYPVSTSCGSRVAQQVSLWSKPVKENEWVTIVIGIKLSTDKNVGYMELWFNGEKQTLGNIQFNKYKIAKFSADKKRAYHKTWDGNVPYPKWGSYNQNACNFETYTFYDEMRIGRDLQSVLGPLGSVSTPKDEITSITAPDAVTQGQTVSVSVNYTTSASRDISAMFQLASAPFTVSTQSTKTVPAGTGIATFELEIPEDLAPLVDAYQYQTVLSLVGGGWPDRLDNANKKDVDVLEAEKKEPFSGSPMAIPGMLEMEYYDKGGQGVSYNDTDAENKGGDDFRPGDGVDIASKNGGKTIGYNTDGEWLEYTVNIQQATSYDMNITYASKAGGGKLGIDMDGIELMTGISVPSTGDWNEFDKFTESVQLPSGEHVLRFKIETKGFDLDKVEFVSSAVTNTSDVVESFTFQVFPNPSESGVFKISETLDYEVYDVQGNRVLALSADNVDLSAQSKGIYIMHVGSKQLKLVR